MKLILYFRFFWKHIERENGPIKNCSTSFELQLSQLLRNKHEIQFHRAGERVKYKPGLVLGRSKQFIVQNGAKTELGRSLVGARTELGQS